MSERPFIWAQCHARRCWCSSCWCNQTNEARYKPRGVKDSTATWIKLFLYITLQSVNTESACGFHLKRRLCSVLFDLCVVDHGSHMEHILWRQAGRNGEMFHVQHVPNALILPLWYHRASTDPLYIFFAVVFMCGAQLGQNKKKLFTWLKKSLFEYLDNINGIKGERGWISPTWLCGLRAFW